MCVCVCVCFLFFFLSFFLVCAFDKILIAIFFPQGKEDTVAVKMLKLEASGDDRSDFLAEINVMRGLPPHKNVVK